MDTRRVIESYYQYANPQDRTSDLYPAAALAADVLAADGYVLDEQRSDELGS
jgi:hypothetical protein